MKKITSLLVIAAIATPAFAEIAKPEAMTETAPVAAEVIFETPAVEPVNSDAKLPNGLQFGLGVSATSGINGFVGYANKKYDSFWWKRIGGRLDFATLAPLSSSLEKQIGENIEVGDGLSIGKSDLTGYHFGALVDFYPFGDTWFAGGWRVTGGYVFGSLGVESKLKGTIQGLPGSKIEFEINGTDYRYNGNTIKGMADITWDYSGPYLGTGFDLGIFRGFKIYMDAGVVFTSQTAALGLNVPFDSTLQYYDTGTSTWKPVNPSSPELADFEANKKAALKEANDELGKLKAFPMVKLGFMYRF